MAGTIREICTECVQLIVDVPGYILLLSLATAVIGFITLVRFVSTFRPTCLHPGSDIARRILSFM